MLSKRPRTPPRSGSRTPPSEPTPKASRVLPTHRTATPSTPIFCTLPPTCHLPGRATPLGDSTELETHYAKYHAHHQTECHDPIAAVRKDRGEKIFACHLASCPKLFQTPKTRRLHLIQAHGYPKEYFFAVTNKGVGGLLKKWGEGASMIRGPWKARDRNDGEEEEEEDDNEDEEQEQEGEDAMDSRPDGHGTQAVPHQHQQQIVAHADMPDHSRLVIEEDSDSDDSDVTEKKARSVIASGSEGEEEEEDNVDNIANAMESLSLVPTTIRFGRGAKRGGLSHRNGRGGGHNYHPNGERGSGRGRRGRGRGRGGGGGGEGGANRRGPGGGNNRNEHQSAPSQAPAAAPAPRPTRPPMPPRGLGGPKRSGFPGRGGIGGRGSISRGGPSGAK
ncbi:hypothetical protein NLI96_g1829 [Meripilus lineatus]|uniref:C2H2-type domain-containing protein n=1 Tax=Meripilus lineatus TaxID=2056292 RepID=A0AAD5YMK4_9APHY|nr:hypothetical protein NLI96_g1829 [Physisporinus lineatus]